MGEERPHESSCCCRAWRGGCPLGLPADRCISIRRRPHVERLYRPQARPQRAQQELLKLRSSGDEEAITTGRRLIARLLERTKAEYDRHAAGERKNPPVIDILIVSGGGDWGAFGAGFLKGWQKIPPSIRWRSRSSMP